MLTYYDTLAGSASQRIRRGTHDQLNSIAKGRVQETTEGLTQLDRDLFGCKGENGSQGDNGEEVESKYGGSAPLKDTSDDTKRHKDEEDIHII